MRYLARGQGRKTGVLGWSSLGQIHSISMTGRLCYGRSIAGPWEAQVPGSQGWFTLLRVWLGPCLPALSYLVSQGLEVCLSGTALAQPSSLRGAGSFSAVTVFETGFLPAAQSFACLCILSVSTAWLGKVL